ncbi:MAG: acetoacetate decarboxylase family protein [Actinobacteria bacterium]|nr:acetoacetate decarboxylase family protein [Actinomycetota bacterium]MBU1945054.1 acetoacetate decarboxylase family protein [Actinomycetota bacterium]MBU2686610.1 acetoacetate decarboxylase family protein [Actinomycetota bacterium]
MLYAMSREELLRVAQKDLVARAFGAWMILVAFRTDPGFVSSVLPKPLEPGGEPLGLAFVGVYPDTNMGITTEECGIFVRARHRREDGWYCLAMPVTSDIALISGREHLGYPKKIAEEISVSEEGGAISGTVIRHGEEILRVDCEATGEAVLQDMYRFAPPTTTLEGAPALKMICFLFKYSFRGDGLGFDYMPRLLRHVTLVRPHPGTVNCKGTITLRSTPTDPLGEIPVDEVLATFYGRWDQQLMFARTVGRAFNPLAFLPHAMFKADYLHTPPGDSDEKSTLREQLYLIRRMRKY